MFTTPCWVSSSQELLPHFMPRATRRMASNALNKTLLSRSRRAPFSNTRVGCCPQRGRRRQHDRSTHVTTSGSDLDTNMRALRLQLGSCPRGDNLGCSVDVPVCRPLRNRCFSTFSTSRGSEEEEEEEKGEEGGLAEAPGVRLNKRLAQLGLCSRREADQWIEAGWVQVNGVTATMGLRVRSSDRISVHKNAKEHQSNLVTILLNKPIGYVSGQAEHGHPPAVNLLHESTRWVEDRSRRSFSYAHLRKLAPAGRLDIDSTGLLVLTQDGRIARTLIGSDEHVGQQEVEKEYLVRVVLDPSRLARYREYERHQQKHDTQARRRCQTQASGPANDLLDSIEFFADELPVVSTDVESVFPDSSLSLLRHGLSLDGAPLKPAQVEWINPEQLRMTLVEGRKRQIRRMCEQVGLHVVGLKRVRIGNVLLRDLPVGQWRYLGPQEYF